MIGCRNAYELDLLEKYGVDTVIGIDLYSHDPRIKVMDMMDLKFEDNSFDLIYCSHALEHALDVQKVTTEIIRVAKNEANVLIEVPINYQVRGADLHDLKSFEKIHEVFQQNQGLINLSLIYGKNISAETKGNVLRTDVARIILTIQKGKV